MAVADEPIARQGGSCRTPADGPLVCLRRSRLDGPQNLLAGVVHAPAHRPQVECSQVKQERLIKDGCLRKIEPSRDHLVGQCKPHLLAANLTRVEISGPFNSTTILLKTPDLPNANLIGARLAKADPHGADLPGSALAIDRAGLADRALRYSIAARGCRWSPPRRNLWIRPALLTLVVAHVCGFLTVHTLAFDRTKLVVYRFLACRAF